jgi:hypothetical protein
MGSRLLGKEAWLFRDLGLRWSSFCFSWMTLRPQLSRSLQSLQYGSSGNGTLLGIVALVHAMKSQSAIFMGFSATSCTANSTRKGLYKAAATSSFRWQCKRESVWEPELE